MSMSSPEQAQQNASPEHRAVAHWLRHTADLRLRTGVLAGKRVDYFKGRAAVKALLSPAYKKLSNVPSVADEPAAEALLTQMIPCAFYLRAERGDHLPPPSSGPGSSSSSSSGSGPPPKQPRALKIAQAQRFKQDEYFVWFLPPSQLKTMLGAVGLVTLVLAGCMFPLWPIKLRIGVWYLSIAVLGLIGLFFAIAIVRLIFWGITKVVYKPGIWIFPKLFDDVGVIESFIPWWEWDVPPPKKGHKKRSKKDAAEAPASTTGQSSATDAPHAGLAPKLRNGGAAPPSSGGGAKVEEVIE